MFSASEDSTNILQPPLSLFDLQKIDFRSGITLKLKSIACFQTAKMMECLVLHLFDLLGLIYQPPLQFCMRKCLEAVCSKSCTLKRSVPLSPLVHTQRN